MTAFHAGKSVIAVGFTTAMLLVTSGCTAAPHASAPPALVPDPPTTSPATTAPAVAAAAAAPDGLTAFGATAAAWDRNHHMDGRFDKGSAYNPNPNLGDGTHFDDQYYNVTTVSGRVVGYEMRLPAGTSITEARAEVKVSQFPAGTRTRWYKVKDTCAQEMVQSALLARDTGALDPGGTVLVEFSSGTAADHYAAGSVTDVTLLGSEDSGPDGTGC